MGKKTLRNLLVLLVCCLPAGCYTASPAIRGYAIVYGISVYDGAYAEGVGNNLMYADDDAIGVSELFADQGYHVIARLNSNATLENLEYDIASVAGMIDEQDSFLFYFSGHGISYTFGGSTITESEPINGDSSDEWIFLHGAVDYDALIDLDKALSDDQLAEILSPIETNRKVVIIDACNSGGFIGTQCEIDGVPQDGENGKSLGIIDALTTYLSFQKQTGVDIPANQAVVISAAGELELSYEAYEYSHGVFTYHFLNSIYDADSNNDGVIALRECYAYARNMIESTWQYAAFIPRISGGPVDFVLFRAAP